MDIWARYPFADLTKPRIETMIKFFRQIRLDLMEKNKTGKYFKYAIGEIILVVIGIFIALQLNNWNENRKIKNIEQVLLSDLKIEIKTSISELQYVIDSHTENLAAASLLTEFMYDREKGRKTDRAIWSKAFKDMDYNVTYDPKLGILKSIITSGKIDYISNKELRYKLSSLNDLIIDTNESTNEITKNRPLLYWTTINKYIERQPDESVETNYGKLFNDSEFIWWLGWLESVRKEGLEEENDLKKTLEHIIELINKELK